MPPSPPPFTEFDPPKRVALWRWFIDGGYINKSACDRAFERMHNRDAIGDRVHLFFALIGCVCLLGPQSVAQIAIAPLMVFFVVRVLNTFPLWVHAFGQPVIIAALLLAMWMGTTLLWSRDLLLGLEEIARLRWFVLTGFLYPVVRHRKLLISALLIGYGFAMLAQIIDAFNGFAVPALADYFWHDPSRISGWFKPVVGGSLFVCGLGLVLPIAILDHGRMRLLGAGASLLMLVSIIATGSRGAWIAIIPLVLIVVCFAVWMRRIRLRSAAALGMIAIALLASTLIFAGSSVRQRIDKARSEIALALDGEFDTETGARIRMAQLASQATIEHPIQGVGAGGYRAWAQPRDPENTRVFDHAHNTLLQLSSTLGIPGVLLALLLLCVMLRNAYCAAMRGGATGFAFAPLFGIIGLLCVSMTDVVLINAHTAAMLGALAALSPAYLPEAEQIKLLDKRETE